MLGEKCPALVFLREHVTRVEDEIQDCDVRPQKDVGYEGLLDRVRRLSFSSRIFVRTDVGERPAVKASLLDRGEIVRDQIISETVSFLDRSPERIGSWVPPQTDRIPCSGCEGLMSASVRIVAVDRRAPGILARVHVRARSHREIHLFSRAIEEHRSRPVTLVQARERYNLLARCHGLHGLRVVFVPFDGARLPHIEIILPEGESIRTVQSLEDLRLVIDFSVVVLVQQHVDRSFIGAVREKYFVAGTESHEPWFLEAIRDDFRAEAGRHSYLRAVRLRDDLRPVVGRRRMVRGRKLLRRELEGQSRRGDEQCTARQKPGGEDLHFASVQLV